MTEQENVSGDSLLKEVIKGRQPFSPIVAEHVFKRYIALLYRLCIEEKNEYDVLVGPGDSGAVMVYFAELFYHAVQKPAPPKLVLPVQRYTNPDDETSDLFDNSVLLSDALGQLSDISPAKVLFVDDEIWKANSASSVARLLVSALASKNNLENRIVFTIVAENHGFEWHYDISPIAIQYYAFSKNISGRNNVILRLLSEGEQIQLDRSTEPYLAPTEVDGQTRKMDLLFNGQIKVPSRSADTIPSYAHISPSADLLQLKSQVEGRLMVLIQEAIEEYTQGHIKFLF